MKINAKKIKCVVWDLDNTLWDGILLEDQEVNLKKKVIDIISELDRRGILNSIVSKNDYELAMNKLSDFGIKDYFLYPQINWNAKSINVEQIAKELNLSLDNFAFIDDQEYEREEVKKVHPEVLCLSEKLLYEVLDMEEFKPKFLTEDSKNRRLLYMSDIKRKKEEEQYQGPKQEFLRELKMIMTIKKADETDLKRVEELTLRTHQLNTTGYSYSYDELKMILDSQKYVLYVMNLEDRFGDYGKIGLCLIEKKRDCWIIKLLVFSCRVISRGLSEMFLSYICNLAKEKGVRLLAEFFVTKCNRIMYVTYKFHGFYEIKQNENEILLECKFNADFSYPPHIRLNVL